MRQTTLVAATMAAAVQAAQDSRTFAVLRFFGDGPMMEGRVDPIIAPGKTASHVHTIQGGSAFGVSATGETMMTSECSTALIEGDNSAYWVPKLYFHDKEAGTLEDVDMFYMNVYYFFEPTDDEVVSFPIGLQMVSGNPTYRDCPNFGGIIQTDGGNASGIQPTQWTCPRSGYDPASRPSAAESDGSTAGIQDPNNQQAGQGFPFSECDGYASPLRMDVHFPSCYDPSAGLTDYANNMAFPTINYLTGKQNCPEGWTHVPHLFYEMYWNTPLFADRWTPNQGYQPFVLSNGDLSGCAAHGDFLAAWDEDILQHIIDTCNAGDLGMDQCAGITVRDKSTSCNVASPIDEEIAGNLTALPGNNPVEGWGTTYGMAAGETSYESAAEPSPEPASSTSTTTSSSEYEAAAPTTTPTTPTTPEAAPSTTTAVTTLPDGHAVTTTVVDWVTTMVYDTTYTTVYVNAKREPEEAEAKREVEMEDRDVGHGHGHGLAHNHLIRHRSPRRARK